MQIKTDDKSTFRKIAQMGLKANLKRSFGRKILLNISLSFATLGGFKTHEALFLGYTYLNLNQKWGFPKLQNQGCRFLQHAEIFSQHAKILEANLMNLSKTLDIKFCTKNEF